MTVAVPITTASAPAAASPHHKFALRCPFSFVKIAILPDHGAKSVVSDIKRLKFAIQNELRGAFGEVGAARADFDLLTVTPQAASADATMTAIIRIRQSELHLLWAALTMCTAIDSMLCKLQVLHVSPSLLGLACPRFL